MIFDILIFKNLDKNLKIFKENHFILYFFLTNKNHCLYFVLFILLLNLY